jgi:anti-sigma regulatory factor (Ser/Thr protein kinase)
VPDELSLELAGIYPHAQLDRILRQMEPILTLRDSVKVRLDMSRLLFLGPTSQAVLGAVFARAIARGHLADGSVAILPRAPHVSRYLQRMDVFREILELPEDFERHEPQGFRPLCQYRSDEECYTVGYELVEAIREACDLGEKDPAALAIHVCLGELAENVIFHASSPLGGFAIAQAWKRRREVEVAIVDVGVGIRASLTQNPDYAHIAEDAMAIETALEPMVTSTPDRNTGLGLSLTRYLLRRNGGNLMVRSGRGAVYAGSQERSETTEIAFPGTIVSLTAKTDHPLDLQEAYEDLRTAGYRPDDDD